MYFELLGEVVYFVFVVVEHLVFVGEVSLVVDY